MLFRDKISFIVAGLGNPGKEYEGTRHNCGYDALDYAAKKLGVGIIRKKFSSLTATAKIKGTSVLLMKPLTYMNLSGEAIAAAARFYKIPSQRVIVLCDDIALSCGNIRIRPKGSPGGHNGLKNIIACLHSEEFPRIRIGVGNDRGDDLKDFVLDKPSKQHRELINSRYEDIYSALEQIAEGHIEKAMSDFNSKR